MNILIIGGAGYIGSVIAEQLSKKHKIFIYDNLSAGFKELISKKYIFILGDILDKNKLNTTFSKYKFDLVIHCAAKIIVSESVLKPLEYFENNVQGTNNVLQAMVKHNVKNIIFSSTAAVYGQTDKMPIVEQTNKNPCNPYGMSKLAAEMLITSTSISNNINYVIFRFFNVAGASPTLNSGLMNKKSTLLIPSLNRAILNNTVPNIYGNKYKTKDGTCVRDYIHVQDLAHAHELGINLIKSNKSGIYNLGSNKGYSNLEILNLAFKLRQLKAKYKVLSNRQGDPAILITSNKLALKELKWKPRYSLKNMINSDFEFQKININHKL